MTLLTKPIQELLNVHNGLWDMNQEVVFYGERYQTYTASHKGYTSVLLPSKKTGTNLLYITQNLNKSTYGTIEIQRAAKQGKIIRITWIVDTSNGQYEYKGLIKTTPELTHIESYSSYGTAVVYTSDPNYKTIKSRY